METRNFDKRLLFGILLLIAGFLVLGSNLGFIPYVVKKVVFSWRMILIVIGLSQLLFSRNKAVGVLLIAIGSLFYLPEFITLPFSMRELFWPIVIIAVGLLFISRQTSVSGKTNFQQSGEDFIDDVAIFGGSERIVESQNFQGGKITSIFGGSTFNLTSARLSSQGAILDLVTIFGGSKFVVPRDWKVRVEVVSIFGGFTDKRFPNPEAMQQPNEIIIKGFVIFGGGEIISY